MPADPQDPRSEQKQREDERALLSLFPPSNDPSTTPGIMELWDAACIYKARQYAPLNMQAVRDQAFIKRIVRFTYEFRGNESDCLRTWSDIGDEARALYPSELQGGTMNHTDWKPDVQYRALSPTVLAVSRTRIEGTWAAYVDSVPGVNHDLETQPVLNQGAKLPEPVARALWPEYQDLPYAR